MGLHSAVVSLTLYAASEMLANIILREVLSMVCAAGVLNPPPRHHLLSGERGVLFIIDFKLLPYFEYCV